MAVRPCPALSHAALSGNSERSPCSEAGDDAALGDQPGDQPRRRHVEGRVGDRRARRDDARAHHPAIDDAGDLGDLAPVALLDRDLAAVAHASSRWSARQADIERHAVVVRRQRLQIGADLVADVAGGGGAVGADDGRGRPAPAASGGRRHCRRSRCAARRDCRAPRPSGARPGCAAGSRRPRRARRSRRHAPDRSAPSPCPSRRSRASRHCSG